MSALAHVLVLLFLLTAPSQGTNDPLERLQVWIERARIAPRSVNERRTAELRAILGDLRLLRAGGGREPAEIDLGLVELASLERRATFPEDPALEASARLGRSELETELGRDGGTLALRLASEVLDPARRRPRAERLLAAELLAGVHRPETLDLLRATAREQDRELARAAAQALCGWPDSSAHLFFLEEIERGQAFARVAAEHFEHLAPTLDPQVLERLGNDVARLYLSEDWRDAARARGLVGALDASRAVPFLIEALTTWERRAGEGRGSKRIRSEIVQELQRLSGRRIGAEPARWSEWWQGVCAGRIALPGEVVERGGELSSATFFGLHAATDRVVFVVDRSGSMQTPFGTSGRTRHAEAIDQLLRFLRQSGDDTRFGVALFSDEGVAWRGKLAPASEGNLELARRWLEGKPPEGETLLFEGLRAGLGLDPRGRLALERCDADTVIVLCDGATTDGPGWVERWLLEENERAQLVIHCVQIGSEGNGTLEALARGTGGEFLRVQG